MSTNPSDNEPDDYPPLLGLDGQPVEITDEKLHELIDAMRDVNPDSDHQLHDIAVEDNNLTDYLLALNAMAGLGAITLPPGSAGDLVGNDVIPVILLGVDYECPNCSELHREHVAFRVVEGLPDLFDKMAVMARGVIANGYQLPT